MFRQSNPQWSAVRLRRSDRHKRARLLLLGAAALCLPVAFACRNSPVGVTNPHFVGTVASVTSASGGVDVLLDVLDPDQAADRVVIWVRQRTVITVQRDGEYRLASISDIVPGTRLAVVHTGVEYRSLPPQYEAVRIEIVSTPSQ